MKQVTDSPLAHLVSLALATFALGVVLTALVWSGTLWNLFKGRLENLEEFESYAGLTVHLHRELVDYIVIGDYAFLDKMLPRLADNVVSTCPVRTIDMQDVAVCLRLVQELEIDGEIIISSLPYFWSDLINGGRAANTRQHAYRSDRRLFSLDYIRFSFALLRDWSRAPWTLEGTPGNRRKVNDAITFTSTPKDIGRVGGVINNLNNQVYWIEDTSGVDYADAARFWKGYQGNYPDNMDKRLGTFIGPEEFVLKN